MRKKIVLAAAIGAAIGGAALALTGAVARVDGAPRAIVFQPAKAVDPGWRAVACATIEGGCGTDEDEARLYRAANLGPNDYYAILSSGPTLLTLSVETGKSWRVKERWSLADYVPTSGEGHGGDLADPPHLFPALYPLGPGDWGVAVLTGRSEMYSGGGASIEAADFISLKAIAASAKNAKPAYGGVPFSCSTMIRACFSEHDYKTSKHCHDEMSGSLRIRYAPAPSGGKRHGWTFVWSETNWPQDTPEAKATHEISTLDVPPDGLFGKTLDHFAYCGGGMAD